MRRRAWTVPVVVLVVALVGCSSGGEDVATNTTGSMAPPESSTSVADEPEPDGPVTLVLVAPDGWATSADGLVVAERDVDLAGTDPGGPRIIDVTTVDQTAFVAEATAGELTREPEEMTVDGLSALAVTFTDPTPTGGSLATTTLVVETGEGTAQVFVLQAPTAAAADAEAVLLAAIQPGD